MMNIPVEIVCALFVGIIGMQGWVLVEVVRLKVKVAVLMQRVFHKGAPKEEEDV